MLCFQGGELDVVKLLDFGLVKELAVDADAQLTGVSTLLGTPQYMAPEIDPRARRVGRALRYLRARSGRLLLAGGRGRVRR